MRKKFVYFVLVPLLALSLVLYFFLAGWIESSLESAGEAIVGARVEIDDRDCVAVSYPGFFRDLHRVLHRA